MPKSHHPKTVTGEVAKNPTKAALNESNEMSYLSDGRNVQQDYYRLSNRERQLKLVEGIEDTEQIAYILGKTGGAAKDITKQIQKIHEQDLLELKALVYLQSLPDTSPEYTALKTMTGGHNRESIAHMLAEKQMKKLYMSQVERILDTDVLKTVYSKEIKRGADAFKGLWG
jgi:hypothetical protein